MARKNKKQVEEVISETTEPQEEPIAETQPEPTAEQPRKHGPIDYVEKAIQLLEAEKPCENYHTALKMLMGAKIFIKKEVG